MKIKRVILIATSLVAAAAAGSAVTYGALWVYSGEPKVKPK